MSCFRRAPLAAAVASALLVISPSRAATQYFPPIPGGGISVSLQPVASGLLSPVDVQSTPDNTGRLVVTDQRGTVKIVQGGVVQSTILDMSALLPTPANGGRYDERGLFGFAYDPQFNVPGSIGFHKVYTYSNEPVNGTADFTTPVSSITMDHQNVVSQWTMSSTNPDQVDPASRQVLLKIDEPYFNHDGGPIKFGPDGMLYISQGDGGGANDNGDGHTVAPNPQYPTQNLGNAQDPTKALGKILRIDVHGTAAGNTLAADPNPLSANGKYNIPADNPFINAPAINGAPVVKEIYAYGLRNVYRYSFDKGGTHALIAGDVGQNNVEEIDNIVKGGNYGWHIKEGTTAFDPTSGGVTTDLTGVPVGVTDPNGNFTPLIDPLAEYDHTQGSAIVGGFVYRGSLMPLLQGKYIFGDFAPAIGVAGGKLFYADLTTGQINQFNGGISLLPTEYIKGMGEDANGEIYVTTSTVLGPSLKSDGTGGGSVYEIVPEPASLSLIFAGSLLRIRPRRRKA